MISPQLSVVIVNYNGLPFLGACLDSVIRETAPGSFEIIVVDNASTDQSMQMVSERYPDVLLVRNNVNIGFAAANNQGIGAARGSYVLLLNPDTVIHDRAIDRVASFLENNPSAGVAGCRLKFPDEKVQISIGAFPSVRGEFFTSTFLYLLLPKNAVVGRKGISVFDSDKEQKVEWICGAFFMIRKSLIDKIGPLDTRFFMYSEEVDFCRRTWESGAGVWYTPCASVTHFWGGMSAVNRRVIVWSTASQILLFRKHYRGIEKFLLVSLKIMGLVLRTVVYALSGALTGNRLLIEKSSFVAAAATAMLLGPPERVWKY